MPLHGVFGGQVARSILGRLMLGLRLAHIRARGASPNPAASRALACTGCAESDALFFEVDGRPRETIEEGNFAQELGRLQVAHIPCDMRDEPKRAACEEEEAAPPRRLVSHMAVSARDGTSLGSGGDAAASLAAHWGPVFSSAHGVPQASAERFFQHVPRYGEEMDVLDHDAFCDIGRHVNQSSLGPDGVPYRAWLAGRGTPLRMLYAVYVSLANRVAPPLQFNGALSVSSLQVGKTTSTTGYEVMAPLSRPLTFSNSCQKIVATYFWASLELIAMVLAHPARRGFVWGRRMLVNVLGDLV